uniref:Uncharacterized protein n=1 Tax=Ditylenchus dipsaci TaxID=166011 RepID=A0A915DXL9_9BILA
MIGEYFHTDTELHKLSESTGSPNPGNLLLHASLKAAQNIPFPNVTWNFAKFFITGYQQRSLGYSQKKPFDQTFYYIFFEKEDSELVWIYGIKEVTNMYKEWSYEKRKMAG